MINPIVPLSLKGVIWYQGESDVGIGEDYYYTMKVLIKGWKNKFEQHDMPFYFVQIAPFTYNKSPYELPKILNSQLFAMKKNTEMAVISDYGDLKNIHPENKKNTSSKTFKMGSFRTVWKIHRKKRTNF